MIKWMTTFLIMHSAIVVHAQFKEANVLEGEIGIMAGAAHYFGDLNTRASLNRPKMAFGIMFRKQFGDYVALRVQGTYAQLGYSDVHSKNEVQRIRNLSFNSNIFELAVMGDFNFFKFMPSDRDYRFTPYASLGVGFFNFNPYAFLDGDQFFLRELGTEGQGSASFPDRKTYGDFALVFPIGFGIKYGLNPRTNLTFEIMHRFTTTDYLDDVSTTFAGIDAFPSLPGGELSPVQLLQDRSWATSPVPIGIAGRQRGVSTRKDQFVTAMVGITINLTSYRCPPTY